MKKETLLFDHILQDIRSSRKENIKSIVFYGSLLTVLGALLIASYSLAPVLFIYYLLCYAVALGTLVYKIVKHSCHLAALSHSARDADCLVTDKLVNAESIDRYRGNNPIGRYRLHFAQYGQYLIPRKNYVWSETFSMSDQGVYNYSIPGDEFYLILSKPHSGKILFAYNKKMFDLEKSAN